MAEARYIPEGSPFHTEPDGFRVWETATGFLVSNNSNGNTYLGDLRGVARFIERERSARSEMDMLNWKAWIILQKLRSDTYDG